MRKSAGIFAALPAAVLAAGCVTATSTPSATADAAKGTDASVSGDAGNADAAKTTPQPPVIDLVVDANRDGVPKADDKADQDFEAAFDATHGAIFLPNLDDDDGDQLEDFYDDKINGDADAADLAKVLLQPWKDAPNEAVGTLTIDPPNRARVWVKLQDGSWGQLVGALGNCDTDDTCQPTPSFDMNADWIRTGLELRVEGRQLRMNSTDWSGNIKLTWTIKDKTSGKAYDAAGAENGVDTVVMRVAAWLLNGNLSEFDKWRSLRYGTSSPDYTFNKDLDDASAAIGAAVKYETYDTSSYADRWTQDFFQTGLVYMPAPDGKVQGFRMFNARPFANAGGKGLPINWMRKNLLGPDQAIIAVYKKPNSGSSYDSHGNHDLLPPYKTATADYKYGRVVTGSGVLPETWAWYDAQRAQGPRLQLDSAWLLVGHIDEFLSYYPAKTARGWKLMVGSNKMAKDMFEKAQKDGNGKATVMPGRQGWTPANKLESLEQTVDDVLKNQDVLQWSQEAEVKVQANLTKTLIPELELKDDEYVYMPFLTESVSGKKIAWQPGTVNCLVIGNHAMIPKPFGIIINGVDVFEKDLNDRLGTAANALGADGQGMKVHFVDDWYGYHINEGEVHCGTNPEMPPASKLKWWDLARPE